MQLLIGKINGRESHRELAGQHPAVPNAQLKRIVAAGDTNIDYCFLYETVAGQTSS